MKRNDGDIDAGKNACWRGAQAALMPDSLAVDENVSYGISLPRERIHDSMACFQRELVLA